MSHLSRPIFRHAGGFVLAAACAVCLLSAPAARAQGLYQSPSASQPTGLSPQGVASADLARSGFQSLVVTDSLNANMKVYLGTGPGTFAPAFTYATCAGPTAVAAVDFTNDGYPDVIVACPASNTVDFFTNQGAVSPGSFGTPQTWNVTDPVAMVVGYFAGNGTPGLAVASGSGGISILLDEGGSPVVRTVAAAGTLTGIAAGDFNNDGSPDLAVSDSAGNQVMIFTNDGSGNFTAAGTYAVGTAPSGVVAADFNKDGNLDLAVTNKGSNNVTVLPGHGDGTFGAGTTQSAGIQPIALVTTDVNSDGNPDVVVFDAQNASSTTEGAVSVLLGNGDGTLQPPQIADLTAVPGTVAAVADFNRDGKPDLAITQASANLVSLLINNTLPTPYPGGRSFASPTAIPAGNGNMADSITAADFNLDGKLDVAVSYLEDNAVRVLLNNGSGGFNLSATYPVGNQPYFVTSGDLNGDGYPDLVAVNSAVNSPNGSISVLLNNGKGGNGTFAPAVTYNVGRLPYQVAIGDLNGDGYPDLAVTNYGADTVSILYGSKTGAFTPGPTLTTGKNPYGVTIADFAHNGHPDIAVTCFGNDMLYVFPNQGDGTFGSPFITSTGAGPMSLVAGDFNRDGKLDIVVANATGGPAGDTNPITSGNNISFFAGNGDGTFQAGVISPSLNFPDSIAAGDVNGDGILDIVGVAPNFNEVVVTLGKGDGTFGTTQQRGVFAAPKQPWGIALGDFNNDGKLDIVTANTYHQVNITIPAYQNRYMTQYPAVPGGVPSVNLLTNISGASIFMSFSPSTFPLPAINTGVTITASVQPALSGPTPTGSIIVEDASGAPYGSGPYPLNSGIATASTGRLGSGTYLFTTLYSGDANYQPTTASGAGFAVTVAGTPVALTLNPSSVAYASNFSVTATVTGTAVPGAPAGTVTLYGASGNTTFTLGTVTLTPSGNNGVATGTYTAVGPNLNVGTYSIYGFFTPSNANYQPGSSPNVALTVTPEPTSLAIGCSGGFFSDTCTATVTASTTNTPVPAGNIVNFSVNSGTPVTETIGANGKASYTFGAIFGSFTVSATFPQQSNYLSSTNSTTVICFFFCGFDRRNPTAFSSFSGLGLNGNSSNGAIARNGFRRVPFSMF